MAIFVGVVLAIAAAVSWGLGMVVHRLDQARRKTRTGRYEWQPQRERAARRLKGVSRLPEDRQALLEFIRTRQGVEAYVEPRTLVSPLTVVLVAADGEWSRFPLDDDGFLRELERAHDVRVFDAVRHGYPDRMRRYKRPPKEDPGSSNDGPEGAPPGDAS